MQVSLNPHHTKIGSKGNGYYISTAGNVSCGIYDTPPSFGGTEAGNVTLYADRLWLVITPEEAHELAAALIKHADAITA